MKIHKIFSIIVVSVLGAGRVSADPVPACPDIRISAGTNHTCAVRNGAAGCWGNNFFGQLGNNTTISSSVSVPVSGFSSGVTSIEVGNNRSCGVSNGSGFCWGINYDAGLGNGTANQGALIPSQVTGFTSQVTSFSTANGHSCGVKNGAAYCWGLTNANGELGTNSTDPSYAPVNVSGMNSDVTAISISNPGHTCAVKNGGAYCWGLNDMGQLGNNSTVSSSVPVQVTGLASDVTAISVGFKTTCAVKSGSVYCWGRNNNYQFGNNSTVSSLVPIQVPGLSSATAISTRLDYSCALQNGSPLCWGNIGYGNNFAGAYRVPTQIAGVSADMTTVSVGYYHACSANENGAAYCWGYNSDGQLGNPGGTTMTAVRVSTLPGNHSPVLTGPGPRSVLIGQQIQFSVQGSDADCDLLTYSASALPGGANFNAHTRVFTWTPASAGVFTPNFLVSDGQLQASVPVTITVTPPACVFSITPPSNYFFPSGGTSSVSVSASPANCGPNAWTASSNASWITITSGSSGSGNGSVNYSVGVNPTTVTRSSTIAIAGKTHTVTQQGQAGGY